MSAQPSYEEAKATKASLEENCRVWSAKLQAFPKNDGGITPHHVRATTKWRNAQVGYNMAFAQLRAFNKLFLQAYRKEILADWQQRERA